MHLLDEIVEGLVLVKLSPSLFVLLIPDPIHQGYRLLILLLRSGIHRVTILSAHPRAVSHMI